jgi:hypothetical protein
MSFSSNDLRLINDTIEIDFKKNYAIIEFTNSSLSTLITTVQNWFNANFQNFKLISTSMVFHSGQYHLIIIYIVI